jgi:hypothetical protein
MEDFLSPAATKIIAAIDVIQLPKGVHWAEPVCLRNVNLPEDQLTVRVPLSIGPQRAPQARIPVKLHTFQPSEFGNSGRALHWSGPQPSGGPRTWALHRLEQIPYPARNPSQSSVRTDPSLNWRRTNSRSLSLLRMRSELSLYEGVPSSRGSA